MRASEPDRASSKAAAAVLDELIPDRADRATFLQVLANSIEAAHASGPGSWSISLFSSFLRLNVGPMETLTVGRDFIRLFTLDSSMTGSSRRRLKESLIHGPKYKSVPGRKGVVVLNSGELRAAYRWARPAHEALCERAAGLRSRSSFRNSFSEGVITLVETALHRKLPRPSYFAPTTHILIASKSDEETITRASIGARRRADWIVPKSAQRGDLALFFSRRLGLFGEGVVSAEPQPGSKIGRRPACRAAVTAVKEWERPIGLDELRELKRWKWTSYPRGFTTVPSEVSAELWGLIRRRTSAGWAEPPGTKPGTGTRSGGAGFGSPEENKRVEKAAVRFVRHHFEKKDWAVHSVERDRCGYDLKCTVSSRELHVEVKGIRGGACSFILTNQERGRALTDNDFWVYAVTHALRRPKMEIISGNELMRRFKLRPIQWMATPGLKG
jgi:hypothetical protein